MNTVESVVSSFFGIFSKYGFVKATKTKGMIKPDQIQIQLQISIPTKAFKETLYKANLEILETDLPDIVQEFELELTAIKKKDEED